MPRASPAGHRWRCSAPCCWRPGTTCRTCGWPRRWMTAPASAVSAASPLRADVGAHSLRPLPPGAGLAGPGPDTARGGTRPLEAKDVLVWTGTLVNATLILSASIRRDAEARWAGHRRRKPTHSHKAHVGTNSPCCIPRPDAGRVCPQLFSVSLRRSLMGCLSGRCGRGWKRSGGRRSCSWHRAPCEGRTGPHWTPRRAPGAGGSRAP